MLCSQVYESGEGVRALQPPALGKAIFEAIAKFFGQQPATKMKKNLYFRQWEQFQFVDSMLYLIRLDDQFFSGNAKIFFG